MAINEYKITHLGKFFTVSSVFVFLIFKVNDSKFLQDDSDSLQRPEASDGIVQSFQIKEEVLIYPSSEKLTNIPLKSLTEILLDPRM